MIAGSGRPAARSRLDSARPARAAVSRRAPIYTLPIIIVAFVFIVIFAILTELPLWMVGLAAVLALLGYLLERRRPS